MPARLLVTGFGPFPGMAFNPSGAVARRLGASVRLRVSAAGAPRVLVMPTTYAALDAVLAPALDAAPGAVLMIGVAGRTRQVRVEARAVNRAARLRPDAGGHAPRGLALDAAGPAARRAGALAARAEAALRRAGLPVKASHDAGRYLCNAAYYRALALPCPVLFLHIPRAPRIAPRRPVAPARVPRLAWPDRLAAAFADVAVAMARGQRPVQPGRSAT